MTGSPTSSNGYHNNDNVFWRGVDFSGVTLVLGVGTGRLIDLLRQQVQQSGGLLLAVSFRMQELERLAAYWGAELGPAALMRARPRQIPLRDETVDLLVANGVLREVPPEHLETMFDELWRVLVPGGRIRVSDIIEPSEAPYDRAWAERNRIVRKLGWALNRPTALAVDVRQAALAIRSAGFERLGVSLLPGYDLTDAWLQDTVNSLRTMSARLVDRALRDEILNEDVPRLIAAYRQGGQKAAERFVLHGAKSGDLALDMEASFTEEDLVEPE